MTVREGNIEDIPQAVELGIAFHKEADLDWMAPVDPESWERTLRASVGYGALFFVAEVDGRLVGLIYGFIAPCYFNLSVKFAHELVMYVEPESRAGTGAQLLSAFEQEAERLGARPIVGAKSNMKGVPIEAMTRMYRMRGYRELERYFVKEA